MLQQPSNPWAGELVLWVRIASLLFVVSIADMSIQQGALPGCREFLNPLLDTIV